MANCPHSGNSAKSLAQEAILPNHWPRQFCQISGTSNSAKSLAQQSVLPNHWLIPPHTGNSAKSLAHCPHTGYSAKSLAQTILPILWLRQFCQITGASNSAKSVAHSSTNMRKFCCQITGTLPLARSSRYRQTGNSAKSLARSYRQFCHITGTGNSTKSLA